jgi:hypothetical protein
MERAEIVPEEEEARVGEIGGKTLGARAVVHEVAVFWGKVLQDVLFVYMCVCGGGG